MLQDLDSMNGTELNGEPMEKGERYLLKDGDTIKFGSVKVKVLILDDSGEAALEASASAHSGMTHGVPHSVDSRWVIRGRATGDMP